MTDITAIIELLIKLVVLVICIFVIPAIKAKYSESELNNILKWIDIAVQAAEQLFDTNQGSEKKQYVLDFLNSVGLKTNESYIENAIESAVLELHNALYGTETDSVEEDIKETEKIETEAAEKSTEVSEETEEPKTESESEVDEEWQSTEQ